MRYRIAVVTLSCFGLLFGLEALAENSCEKVFGSAKPSIEARFSKLRDEWDAVRKAQGIHVLLREAFWPMLTEFRSSVESSSLEQVQEILKEQKASTAIMSSPYEQKSQMFPPIVKLQSPKTSVEEGADPRASEEFGKKMSYVQRVFDHSAFNGLGANGLFGYDRGFAPEISATTEALWIAASPAAHEKYGATVWSLARMATPVNAYGKNFTKTLMRTTQVMIEIARAHLESESARIAKENPDLIKMETARGRDTQETSLGPLNSFTEGIVTFHQVLSMMLAERVPGAETGADALRGIIFDGNSRMGLTAEFTARLPMGFIGPMTLSGGHITHPLVRTADGKLSLSNEAIDFLKGRKDRAGERRKNGVCPFASLFRTEEEAQPKAGLQYLAEAYWRVFEIVSREEKAH